MLPGENIESTLEKIKSNKDLVKKFVDEIVSKFRGRDKKTFDSIFTSKFPSTEYFREVFQLGITYNDLEKLNQDACLAVKATLLENKELDLTGEQCDKLIASLKSVENFLRIRDVDLRGSIGIEAQFLSRCSGIAAKSSTAIAVVNAAAAEAIVDIDLSDTQSRYYRDQKGDEFSIK